ncbi:ATP-binding protein [Longispora fulva]|uniref:DNA-binding CsgD family transcriptional regulator n=1 Tax=Longispora fulva TaxID=619741 RepID=A0A8J7KE34_9ACTN|nr:LuxR family transcriptional regulator [Longispora fulva]MBG6134715.1 DNA-binding CsgD family transcriptional regulator [Longispora fulva]
MAGRLVGRDTQVAALLEALACPPVVAVVDGEPGIGKSALVRHVGGLLVGRTVLTGRCEPLREPLAYEPFLEALSGAPPTPDLSPVTGALRRPLPELAGWLPPALPELGHAELDRHRLFRAVLALLDGLGPTVLVLEDLHWADRGTVDLLSVLTARMPDRLALLVTYRAADLPDGSVLAATTRLPPGVRRLRLSLPPLTRGQVAELAGDLAADDLYARTLGVPFAVEEVLRLLADRPGVTEVPGGVRDSVVARLALLGGPARLLVEAAAVLGAPATAGVLAAVARLDPATAVDGLCEAVRRSLLVTVGGDRLTTVDDRYAPRHVLCQQAVYDSLLGPGRVELHRRAVGALPPDAPAQRAYHARRAGLVADWLRFTEAAAEQALASGDAAGMFGQLQEALAGGHADPACRARLGVLLSRAAPHSLAAADVLATMHGLADDPALPRVARGEILLSLGILTRTHADRGGAGVRYLERAATELSGHPGRAAWAMAVLGSTGWLDDRPTDAHLSWLDRAREVAALAGDPVLTLGVEATRRSALTRAGLPEPRGALPTASGQEADLHRIRLATDQAYSSVWLGRHADAARYVAEVRERTEHLHSDFLRGAVDGTELLLDYCAGRWDGLAGRAGDLIARVHDVALIRHEAELVVGLLALARGDLDDATRGLLVPTQSVPNLALAAAGRVRLALGRGDPATGWRIARDVLRHLRDTTAWVWGADLLPAAVEALGPDSGDLIAEYAAGIAGRDAPAAHAALAACRALAGTGDFAEAGELYDRIPRPYDRARVAEAHGRTLGAAGIARLFAAVAGFGDLGATWDVQRCRSLLRALGVRVPTGPGRRGYGPGLSPREREIADLVASGRTSRQIAESLYLSARTVDTHVARVMRKLGVTRRADIATSRQYVPPTH